MLADRVKVYTGQGVYNYRCYGQDVFSYSCYNNCWQIRSRCIQIHFNHYCTNLLWTVTQAQFDGSIWRLKPLWTGQLIVNADTNLIFDVNLKIKGLICLLFRSIQQQVSKHYQNDVCRQVNLMWCRKVHLK